MSFSCPLILDSHLCWNEGKAEDADADDAPSVEGVVLDSQ
jgi:hypothetical protein